MELLEVQKRTEHLHISLDPIQFNLGGELKVTLGTDHRAVATEVKLVTIDPNGPVKYWPKGTKMAQMTDQEVIDAVLAFLTAEGNPASPPGGVVPTWTTDSPQAITLAPSPDGLSCVVGSPTPGPLVTGAMVTIGFGEASNIADATFTVDIVAGTATQVSVSLGEPRPQP